MLNFTGAALRDRFARHVLILLALALAPAFTVTAFVTNAYRTQRQALAESWSRRGEEALAVHRADDAIDAFRNALAFSRENPRFRLRLAQALAAANRTSEARAYLLTLWADEPGDGAVNLALARLTAADREVAQATRYYHNAIEGAWSARAEDVRRDARLELADFLVEEGAVAQAQAELIALAGDLPADRAQRLHAGDLMRRAGLSREALDVYRQLIAKDRTDRDALAGAGQMAFDRGDYPAAVSYLTRAGRAAPLDPGSQRTLEIARLVRALDPFEPRVPSWDRADRTIEAVGAASERLAACPALSAGDLQALDAERATLSPRLKPQALRRDPDLIDTAMDLVFRIEQASDRCGAPRPIDRALLLVARRHEERPS